MTDKEYAERLSQCASYTPQPAKYQDCMTFGPGCRGPVILEQPKNVIRPVYPFMNYIRDDDIFSSGETPIINIKPRPPQSTCNSQCTISGKHLYPSKWTHQAKTNPMTVPVSDSVEFYQTTMNQGPLTTRGEVCDAVYQNICNLSSGYEKCGPYIINRPSIG